MRTLIALLLSTLPLLASPNTMQGVQFCPLRLNAKENLENLLLWSEDLTQASWLAQNGAAKVNATEFTVDGITLYSGVYQNVSVLASTSYVLTVQAKAAAPRSLHLLYYDAGVGVVESANLVIGVSWTDVSFSFTTGSGASAFVLICDSVPGVAGAIDVQNAQLRRISSSATYVKTTAVPYTTPDGTSVQAWYDPNSPLNTLNGAGMSQLKNLAPDALENYTIWSEDFTQADWTTFNGASKVGVAAGVGPNGENAMEVSFGAGVESAFYEVMPNTPLSSQDYIQSWFVRAVSGTTTIRIESNNDYSGDISIGTSWTWISNATTVSGFRASLRNNSSDNSANVYVLRVQFRRATKSPTYVKTEAIRYVVEDRDLNQSTGASQPLLSRADNAGNLALYSEAVNNAAYTTAAFGGWDPVTKTDTNLWTWTHSPTVEGDGQIVSAAPNSTWTISVDLKAGTKSSVRLYCASGLNGVYVAEAYGPALTLSGSWATYTMNYTVDAGANQLQGCLARSDAADGSVYVRNFSIRQSSWSSDYIATTSTPVYPGQNGSRVLVFDGTDDYMKTATFPLVQPTTVVGVWEPISFAEYAGLFDGFTDFTCAAYRELTHTGRFSFYAGNDWLLIPAADGSYVITLACFDGASGFVSKNGEPSALNMGSNAMNGFTLGATGSGARPGNEATGEFLILNRVLTSAEQSYLVQGLARKAGVNVW